MKIALTTDAGDLVKHIDIPDFNIQPEVLIWGSRIFKNMRAKVAFEHHVYREAFAYVVITEDWKDV